MGIIELLLIAGSPILAFLFVVVELFLPFVGMFFGAG